MKWTSALAIFTLFWVMSAFVVMPFGVRTSDEAGEAKVPGQADSAPANFNAQKILLRTTALALVSFGLFYANYVNGWLTTDMIDITR
jgi:predicted secreted protein